MTLRQLGSGDGTVVGTDTTDTFGDWEITDETPMPGTYVVDVGRKKIKKRGKDLTCKGTTSPPELIA